MTSDEFSQANELHAAGKLDLAERVYQDIVAARPNFFDALHQLGLLQYQKGAYAQALVHMEQAAKLKPGDAEAHSSLGLVLAAINQPEDALASYDMALTLKPDLAEAHYRRGNVQMALNHPPAALASYDRGLALDPYLPDAHNNRGLALMALGRPAEALANYDSLLDRCPDYVLAHCNQGLALLALNRPLDALTSFDNALAFRADYLEAMNNRGNTLKEMGRLDEAIESYDRALAICPDAAETLNNRGVVLHALGRSDLALADHDRALALKPDYAEAFNNRGSCLLVFNRPVDALLDYDRALALKPDLAEAHENRGIVLTEIGYFDEANRAAERAASLAPRCARIYYNLVETRRVAPGDPWIPALQDMTRDSASLTVSEQIYLHFALGKALADIGEGAASFEHLLAGAALKRERTTYDEAATLSGLELTTTAFNDQLMRAGAGQGELSPVPVFIVGMPRSGSTLVEQILASHGDVFAAGEIEEFALAIKALGGDSGHLPHAHEAVDQISGDWRRLGEHYLSSIVAAAPEARRITNKTLDNFRFIGLIHLALPNARIIHMRRDPLDTCLSCFSKLFTGSLPYSYDLGELGRYYRAYHALMAHWRRVLPTDVMLDVDYEDVVADLEGQARSILAFCGLDWDPRCLDFHTTKRWVHTASATQVRQPIYQSSVGRWRPPEALLEPLISALG